MASTTLEALHELEKHERTVVDQFGDERVNLDGLDYGDMLKVVQDLSSSIFAHGMDDLGVRSEVWGAGGAHIPLPIFLTIQGGPVVDVAPIPEEELIRRTGVDAEQLKILGQKKLVNLNLYADSELEKPNPAYAEFDHLKDILDYRVTGCRVHGIRRRKLFGLIGYDDNAQSELIRQLADKFAPHFRKFDLNELNRRLGGALVENHDAAATKLAHNLMYLEILGEPKDKEFVDELGGEEWPYEIEVVLERTRQRKSYLCSPITASFGGTHNYSTDGYHRSFYVSAIEPKPRVRTIGRYREEMAKFSMLTGTQLPPAPPQPFPSRGQLMFTNRSDFENFVAFVSDKRPVLDRADHVLRHMLKLAPNEVEFERLLTELSDLAYDIEKDASKGVVNRLGFPLASAFIAAFVGAVVGEEVYARYPQFVEALTPEGMGREVFLAGLTGIAAAVGGASGKLIEIASTKFATFEPPADVQFSRRVVGEYVADLRYR